MLQCDSKYTLPDGTVCVAETEESGGFVGTDYFPNCIALLDPVDTLGKSVVDLQPGEILTYCVDTDGNVFAYRYTGFLSSLCLAPNEDLEFWDLKYRPELRPFLVELEKLEGVYLTPGTALDAMPAFHVDAVTLAGAGSQ